MILSSAEMKALEEKAFADGVSAASLMEQAGAQIAQAVAQFFPRPGVCLTVFGKGNNGGDALVAARHLSRIGWAVHLIAAFGEKDWGPLVHEKFTEATGCQRDNTGALLRAHGEPLVVLDGLLGIGAQGGLREPLASLARAINQLRRNSHAHVFALDLPTGLDPETGVPDPSCISADTTLAIGFAKQGLVTDVAANFVGRLAVLPLTDLTTRSSHAPPTATVATPVELGNLLPRRPFNSHKGDYGRIGVVAGAPGMLGAAVLCATAASRAGAGLITLYATPDTIERLSVITPPEIMVQPVASFAEVAQRRHDVFALGPGLGPHRHAELLPLIEHVRQPMVVDADGLNALAREPAVMGRFAGERVLTPHPGEMERLDPTAAKRPRHDVVKSFVYRHRRCTLLLKGARTVVGKYGEPMSYNSTGTPGMATGGMGDVLTGVIAALIGQRVRPFDAARLGAWLCGYAGELAIVQGAETEETLTPTRLLDFLAPALRGLRRRCY